MGREIEFGFLEKVGREIDVSCVFGARNLLREQASSGKNSPLHFDEVKR